MNVYQKYFRFLKKKKKKDDAYISGKIMREYKKYFRFLPKDDTHV